MADIQGKILSKYGIDIAQENIFKLYKVDSADISPVDLDQKIEETRKRWNTSINGANERNAERDRGRLEKADKYEAVLKDDKLRKEVFNYYNKPAGANSGSGCNTSPGSGTTDFAKEYFKLIGTTKNVRKADVDFFFKYYQSERKNKKAILEMLNTDLKIKGLGKEGAYAGENDEVDEEGKKKDDSSPLIVNLFQEATILKIRRAIDKYEEAASSDTLCQKYPKLRDGLYDFLEINEVTDAQQFTNLMAQKSREVYAVRQERGAEFVPLVDLFNILQSIEEYQDVVDNIPEFKLLLKYPNLTPYMFAFVEMKPATLKGIVDVANKDYVFRNDTDFLLNYYVPVHDNFGISDGGISGVIRKAEKKAKQNKILNEIDEKLGRNKKRKISIGAEILHWLVYWPIFAVYFVFEVVKAIFTELHRFIIPVFVILFLGENWILPKLGLDNLLILRKVFFKNQWLSYLNDFFGNNPENAFEAILLSLILVIILLAVYVLPGLFVAMFIAEFADVFNKQFDWVGIERTFQQIFMRLRKRTEDQYVAHKKLFVKEKLPKVFINLICLAILVAIIHFTPIGIAKLSEATGYGQKRESAETVVNLNETMNSTEDTLMVITESSANIRSGPDKDYDVVTVVNQGDTFVATGNQETDSNGTVWYEVFIDEGRTQTGWASEKVIEEQ